MRYGMNPHQTAMLVPARHPLSLRSGEPSLINYLDALNAWQLVNEAELATGESVAASFKHVSPAGVASAGVLDRVAQETWGVGDTLSGTLTSAYVRARDADPKSSYGDVVAVSRPVDHALADFLSGVVSDAIVAPGFDPGVVAKLARKKQGSFVIFEADPTYAAPATECRDVFGMRFEQERDCVPITKNFLPGHDQMSGNSIRDALLSLVTLRYTQSNSVALIKDGVSLGIGAGQQSRVDCVRLAAAKAKVWWLRRHPHVRFLRTIPDMKSNERINWQMRFAEGSMTRRQAAEFAMQFGPDAITLYRDEAWRRDWMRRLGGVSLGADGFLPFRDNVDCAAEIGVSTIVEPGGSTRTEEVREAAREHGMLHVETDLRLFHH
jgi:phosphoribosylaminoimidazolecarboxamide formyltransferase / IMP cyclohydrolase